MQNPTMLITITDDDQVRVSFQAPDNSADGIEVTLSPEQAGKVVDALLVCANQAAHRAALKAVSAARGIQA